MPRLTRITLAGLGVGIVGLLIQWIADPSKFDGANKTFGLPFPPGILFLVAFGAATALTLRWWWHPIPSAFIAFWIVGVGGIAGELTPNLTSSNLGTVLGNVVMSVGLIATFCAGIIGAARGRRARRTDVHLSSPSGRA
ncbi:hypothetical protein [Rudaeicoccus suwonensis]|uniref:Uncharacterized protein n=1 Tax=Rudaeicoccus suwonensis TaxID=657409 RepID=A0A561E6W0_9MICO|nr:hypothetical protein [Rudaeicoccus suwonensis]TWE11357.1 hypothetical protein BKA23_0119 [Rudaeicoccus suwonensis]